MKKYLFVLSALAIISLSTSAQPDSAAIHRGHIMRKGIHTYHKHTMANLNLTDEQKQQAKTINQDYHNKVTALEKEDNITLKDYRAQKAALEKERRDKFHALLTPEQKNKMAESKKKQHERMKMMAQKRMEKMKTNLSLTDEQVMKIKEQQQSMLQQEKAIKEDTTLSREQKREQFLSLHKTYKDNVNSILTPEQIKKREELRNERANEWKNKQDNKPS
jgi:Spy/CpxP family protein refolding chaperone